MGFAILAAIIAEITSVVLVSDWLGGLLTLALLALATGAGLAVLAGRGVAILANAGQAMQRGEAVGEVVANGALMALAGVLLVVPGFVSDLAALLLLVPPVRGVVAAWLVKRVKASVVNVAGMNLRGGGGVSGDVPGDVIDTTATEVPAPRGRELP